MKQLKKTIVRKPSFNMRFPIFFVICDLNNEAQMNKKKEINNSTKSSKYMRLKLLRKEAEISRMERF